MGENGPSRDAETARATCAVHGNDPARLIEILHDIQSERGFVPEAVLPVIAGALNLSRAEVHGVMSFYHDFRRAPAGRVTVKVCRAEACRSMGAQRLIERLCGRLGIAPGETSGDGVTVEAVYCLGNCSLSPAAMIDGRLLGRLDDAGLAAAIREAGR
jgi:formate dehydrogenase subunit gamma